MIDRDIGAMVKVCIERMELLTVEEWDWLLDMTEHSGRFGKAWTESRLDRLRALVNRIYETR